MIKVAIFSFVLGVAFSQDVQTFAQHAASGATNEIRSALNADAYEKINEALSP
jgi:hypothetical protein